MPIYEYRPVSGATPCPHCAGGFELLQKMADAPATRCAACGAAVKRVISAPAVPRSGPSLSRENLEKHGFTQYRKADKGVYEKTAGKGPDTITD